LTCDPVIERVFRAKLISLKELNGLASCLQSKVGHLK